ncbi:MULTISPECIES: STAS domain-containing protein [Amycolatopsis]|uniref:STAS domain-containing protein n=1 Tax=Amycolatopsis dongchuanensis TaxID=1070866 RepID=A0ABP8VP49_9PSEU
MSEHPMVRPVGSTADEVIEFRTREERDAVVVEVLGEVDLLTAPHLTAAVADELDGRAPVVVADLSRVDFFGAAGLEALSPLRARAERAGVALRLLASPAVRRLLVLTHTEQELPVHDDLATAIARPG